MDSNPLSDQELSVSSQSIGQKLRRYFFAGLASLFPVVVTIWLVVKIFNIADGLVGNWFGFKVPGLGLLVTLLVILLVGVLSVHFFGRLLFRTIEFWLTRLPIFKKVYPAVKQLTQFLFNEESRQAALRRVVLVQYPRPGTYSIAFVTNETDTLATGSRKTLLTILIPNPPSPFTGPIIFVPVEDVIPLDLTVENAVKLIVSGGVVSSPLRAMERPIH